MRDQSLPLQQPLFPTEKQCSRCHDVKGLECFPLDGRRRDGRAGRCKACVNAVARISYAAQPERHRALVRAYREAHPDKIRERNARYRAANRERVRDWARAWYERHSAEALAQVAAYRATHREAIRERDRRYRLTNWPVLYAKKRAYNRAHAEAVRAWRGRYRAANRERVRGYEQRYAATHVLEHRVRVIRRRARIARAAGTHTANDIRLIYSAQCGRCAYCLVPLAMCMHIDHMTPLSQGGTNSLENLALACQPCNNKKFTLSAGQFLARLIKESRAER